MKLNTKITLLSGLTTLLLIIAAFVGIDYFYKQLAYDTEYAQLQTRADEFASVVSKLPSTEGIDNIARAYIPANGALRIEGHNGKSLLHLQTVDSGQKIAFDDLPEDGEVSYVEDIPTIALTYPIIWPTTHEIVSLQFVQTLPDIARNSDLLHWILVMMAILALLPIYFASSLLSRIIVKPIERLTNTMKQNIETASYNTIAPPKYSKDEIAQMTHTYNDLMTQLQRNYTQQQQFVGNASHELRTPLTVIDSYVQLLQRRGVQNEALTLEAVDAISKQSKSMKQMMEQMLQLASVHETTQMNWQTVSLNELLQDIQSTIIQAYGRDVFITGGEHSLVTDEAKLKQLLFIFLDNARKYSEGPLTIDVTNGSSITIAVRDEGIGIPKEDIPYLFDRFYRVNKDRSRATGGTGLGLSIAAQLGERLGATITITSDVGIGTTVTVTLPKDGGSQR